MNIIHLDTETLKAGKSAFNEYMAAVVCGPSAKIYYDGMIRATGLEVVPGAILACMEQGLVGEDEIVNAAARVSRCTRSTVLSVLYTLCGTDAGRHLWSTDWKGNFQPLSGSQANVLLAN